MQNHMVITGAGSGIGRALAIALSTRDISVIAVGRGEAALLETATLGKAGNIQICQADVSKPAGREKLTSHIGTSSMAGLVHCAGIFPLQSLEKMTLDMWQDAFATNVEARLFLSQAFKPNLGQDGRILFIGSMSATTPRIGSSSYCASKAASFMLQECLKKEWAVEGPAVSSAVPGPVKSKILDQGMNADPAIFPDGQGYIDDPQIDPERLGRFLSWLLLETDRKTYMEKQWDVRHQDHHSHWLGDDPLYMPDE